MRSPEERHYEKHQERIEAARTGRLFAPFHEEAGSLWISEREARLVEAIVDAVTDDARRDAVADLRAQRRLCHDIEQMIETGRLAEEFLAKQERAS